MEYKAIRAIISGGGTGGHIFPAISIASALKDLNPDTEILFVGAEGRMEMEKVPAAGFKIVGLPISGLQRQLSWANIKHDLSLPFKIVQSLRKARKILKEFKPDIAIGVGGYASAPLLWEATRMGIPALIQEQNGFAGLTNKILGSKVGCICVAYEGMERFFPADKIVLTGNPIRKDIVPATPETRSEGEAFYGLDPAKKHILVIGGSLGSATLNSSVKKWIEVGCPGGEGVDMLWQCGKYYLNSVDEFMTAHPEAKDIHHGAFLSRMDLAYAMADVVISRSGASSVSEICAAAKAAVFVPSPNVAEDHQTANANALVSKGAAVMIKDVEAREKLLPATLQLLGDKERLESIAQNAAALAKTDAGAQIAIEVYKLLK